MLFHVGRWNLREAWTSTPFPQCSACRGSVRTQLGFRDGVFPFSTWGVPGRSRRTSRVVLHAPSGHWTTNIPDPLLSEHGVLRHGSNLCTPMRVYVGLCVCLCLFQWVIPTCMSVNNSAWNEIHIYIGDVTKYEYFIQKEQVIFSKYKCFWKAYQRGWGQRYAIRLGSYWMFIHLL